MQPVISTVKSGGKALLLKTSSTKLLQPGQFCTGMLVKRCIRKNDVHVGSMFNDSTGCNKYVKDWKGFLALDPTTDSNEDQTSGPSPSRL